MDMFCVCMCLPFIEAAYMYSSVICICSRCLFNKVLTTQSFDTRMLFHRKVFRYIVAANEKNMLHHKGFTLRFYTQ